MKATIVLHHFWMESKKWEIIEVEVSSKKEAEDQAKIMRSDREKQFNHCSYAVLMTTQAPGGA